MNEADTLLVRRLQAGEESAFREFVDAYRDRITTVLARVAGSRADAEDLAQDTFLKAFGAIARFGGRSALYTWLYRIAVNTARDWLDRRRRRPAVSLDALEDERRYDPPAQGDTPLQALAREDQRRVVREALDRLPEPFRSTLVLREMEGHSYEEVARILQVSVGTVESRVFRARCKLRALLEKGGR